MQIRFNIRNAQSPSNKQYQAVGINDDLELLMEVTEWWIKLHAIDHFEKALKIREMVKSVKYCEGFNR
ncbi:DUF6500 family protein [Amylibacter sp.]|nr:DUF6500 family protein [Amylibacter sp.]